MKTKRSDVLVAGAGPVGLTAAIFLAAQGSKVAIVDAKPHAVTHSYGLALHPATLELLDKLGVVDEILERAIRVPTVAIYHGSERVARIPVASADAPHPYLAILGQDVLEETLARALKREGVHVEWNCRLARFNQSLEQVDIEVDELEERIIGYAAARFDWLVRKTHRVGADYLIGADGHGSLVRRQLGLEFDAVRPAQDFAVFEFAADTAVAHEVALVLHEEGIASLWPLPGGRARWSFAVAPGERQAPEREKNHEPVQVIGPGMYQVLVESHLMDLLARRVPWWKQPAGDIYWRMLVHFEHRLADSFGDGRVWLAGDAAHLTGPAGIQSMNIGMREARQLTQAVIRASSQCGVLESFSAYEASRQREWRRMLGLTGEVVARPDAVPAIAQWKDELVRCLPGSGDALTAMLESLGLEWNG